MISDSSGSESDSSLDAESEELAIKAFKHMRSKLHKPKFCQNKPINSLRTCSLRQKIYKTFVSDSNFELTKSAETYGDTSVDQFYLDKSPVQPSSSAVNISNSTEKDGRLSIKNMHQTEVEVTDLSYLDTGQDADPPSKNKPSISKNSLENLSTSLQSGVNCKDIYVNVNPGKNPQKQKKILTDTKPKELEIMKKSVISEDFEKQDSISPLESQRQKQKQRKLEREKTKGDKWFHMAAPEISEERKHDLEVLQMRKALDPKRFYKSNDTKISPKYFQFGQVVESPADFYSSRIPKKQRKSTIVEELLADAEFRRYNKRKYEEIQEMKRLGKGPYGRMKRIRKKKKQK